MQTGAPQGSGGRSGIARRHVRDRLYDNIFRRSLAGATPLLLGAALALITVQSTTAGADDLTPGAPTFPTEDRCWVAAAQVDGHQAGITVVCVPNPAGAWEVRIR